MAVPHSGRSFNVGHVETARAIGTGRVLVPSGTKQVRPLEERTRRWIQISTTLCARIEASMGRGCLLGSHSVVSVGAGGTDATQHAQGRLPDRRQRGAVRRRQSVEITIVLYGAGALKTTGSRGPAGSYSTITAVVFDGNTAGSSASSANFTPFARSSETAATDSHDPVLA
jgi:hypothetical protein